MITFYLCTMIGSGRKMIYERSSARHTLHMQTLVLWIHSAECHDMHASPGHLLLLYEIYVSCALQDMNLSLKTS